MKLKHVIVAAALIVAMSAAPLVDEALNIFQKERVPRHEQNSQNIAFNMFCGLCAFLLIIAFYLFASRLRTELSFFKNKPVFHIELIKNCERIRNGVMGSKQGEQRESAAGGLLTIQLDSPIVNLNSKFTDDISNNNI